MVLDHRGVPVVLAPLAGGPSTPELAAAVSVAGGLGSIAGGYLSADELRRRMERTRALTSEPIGVNLFVPGPGPTAPDRFAAFSERLRDWARAEAVPVGEPSFSDDDWPAKLELLRAQTPAVVSFTFGCPPGEVLAGLRAAGSEVWVSVTTPEEAAQAAAAGAQALVVQGAEAGGHRASFADREDDPVYGLLPLLSLVHAEVELPLIATGAIATPTGAGRGDRGRRGRRPDRHRIPACTRGGYVSRPSSRDTQCGSDRADPSLHRPSGPRDPQSFHR